jgi:CheY-like chemotaxis protein
MPAGDGLSFLRELRASGDRRRTPVAIVTGQYFIDDRTSRELRHLDADLRFKRIWLEDVIDLAQSLVARSASESH